MRVTQNMLTNQFLYNLSNINSQIQKDQNEMSTGKTLNMPQDNPLAVSQDMAISANLAQANTYQSVISSSLTWMNNSSSTVQSMTQGLQNIQQNILEALNSPNMNEDNIQALAETTQQMISQVYNTLNTKQGNEYLFGGTLTQTKPSSYASTTPITDSDIYVTPGTGTVSAGVSQVTPSQPIASTFSDGTPPLLQVGQTYSLQINLNDIAGGNNPTFSGKVTLLNAQGESIAQATLPTGTDMGTEITLTPTSGTNSGTVGPTITLGGNIFQASSGTTNGSYEQTDSLTLISSGAQQVVSNEVSSGVTMPTSLTAMQMFHQVPQGASQDLQATLANTLSDLQGMATVLSSNSQGASSATMATYRSNLQNDLSNLQANTNQMTNDNAQLGSWIQGIQAVQTQMTTFTNNLSNQQANLQDANMAQVITQYSTDQTVYQSALQMGAQVLLPTLIQYLHG
ncbi:MAG: flagellar hook-associated protein FlgL [Acidibacillus sp.]|nr:flagellar hook-associated protein FlgL [Acidibacillus sp.]